jgi:hypothetical protein
MAVAVESSPKSILGFRIQLGDDNLSGARPATCCQPAGLLHGSRELKPTLQRVRALAGFYFAILGLDLVAILRAL